MTTNIARFNGIFLSSLKPGISFAEAGEFVGKGKRYRITVSYYWKKSFDEIWLLTLYSKNEQATIPGNILKKIAKEIENE